MQGRFDFSTRKCIMAKQMKFLTHGLVIVAAMFLLAACSGGDKGVAEAKKAIREASAAQGAKPTPGPDSDDYLERYQTPEQRLEARQNRLRAAVATSWAAEQVTSATAPPAVP
jgi:hypothetical protein